MRVYEVIISLCKKYEELCVKKYPEAPLPLEILKTFQLINLLTNS